MSSPESRSQSSEITAVAYALQHVIDALVDACGSDLFLYFRVYNSVINATAARLNIPPEELEREIDRIFQEGLDAAGNNTTSPEI